MKENSRKSSLRGNSTKLWKDSVVGAGGKGREAGFSSGSGTHLLERFPVVYCAGAEGVSEFGLKANAVQEGPAHNESI